MGLLGDEYNLACLIVKKEGQEGIARPSRHKLRSSQTSLNQDEASICISMVEERRLRVHNETWTRPLVKAPQHSMEISMSLDEIKNADPSHQI